MGLWGSFLVLGLLNAISSLIMIRDEATKARQEGIYKECDPRDEDHGRHQNEHSLSIAHLSDSAPDSASRRLTNAATQAKSVEKIPLSGCEGDMKTSSLSGQICYVTPTFAKTVQSKSINLPFIHSRKLPDASPPRHTCP